ncbi:MAG: methylated-DNA--[Selenomonadaceae bacterium]|nr:methylated-DNA--[protein]-cysteine S-methyltransferase [Selenomonadaceae bacterium]
MYRRFESPIGKIFIASDGESLTGLWFENQKFFPKNLGDEIDLEIFDQTIDWLEIYFSGKNPEFTPRIKIEGTDFQKKVWKYLQQIPFGKVETYGNIAKNLKTSARAVGNAVARNPISIIIPCHRVIGANGKLTGYAGGIDRKNFLLELESRSSEK